MQIVTRARFGPMVAALLWMGSAGAADALRCGSHLVTSGDDSSAVRRLCGAPEHIEHKTIRRHPSYLRNGKLIFLDGDLIEVSVELWTYNFGPDRLMSRMRFVDGVLEDIETLGYGHNNGDDTDERHADN